MLLDSILRYLCAIRCASINQVLLLPCIGFIWIAFFAGNQLALAAIVTGTSPGVETPTGGGNGKDIVVDIRVLTASSSTTSGPSSQSETSVSKIQTLDETTHFPNVTTTDNLLSTLFHVSSSSSNLSSSTPSTILPVTNSNVFSSLDAQNHNTTDLLQGVPTTVATSTVAPTGHQIMLIIWHTTTSATTTSTTTTASTETQPVLTPAAANIDNKISNILNTPLVTNTWASLMTSTVPSVTNTWASLATNLSSTSSSTVAPVPTVVRQVFADSAPNDTRSIPSLTVLISIGNSNSSAANNNTPMHLFFNVSAVLNMSLFFDENTTSANVSEIMTSTQSPVTETVNTTSALGTSKSSRFRPYVNKELYKSPDWFFPYPGRFPPRARPRLGSKKSNITLTTTPVTQNSNNSVVIRFVNNEPAGL